MDVVHYLNCPAKMLSDSNKTICTLKQPYLVAYLLSSFFRVWVSLFVDVMGRERNSHLLGIVLGVLHVTPILQKKKTLSVKEVKLPKTQI